VNRLVCGFRLLIINSSKVDNVALKLIHFHKLYILEKGYNSIPYDGIKIVRLYTMNMVIPVLITFNPGFHEQNSSRGLQTLSAYPESMQLYKNVKWQAMKTYPSSRRDRLIVAIKEGWSRYYRVTIRVS